MAKANTGKRYTDKQVRAMHDWYMAEPGRTVRQVAVQFGMADHTSVSKLFHRRGLYVKPIGLTSGQEYNTDPFGAAVGDIRMACQRALAREGSMSQGEYEILQAILKVVT